MKIKYAGLAQLQAAFTNYKMAEGRAKSAVSKAGAKMQASAQRHAPVDTGHLKRSITLDAGGLTATVTSEASYAGFQEFGTRFQPGTPHIRPAAEEAASDFKSEIIKVIK